MRRAGGYIAAWTSGSATFGPHPAQWHNRIRHEIWFATGSNPILPHSTISSLPHSSIQSIRIRLQISSHLSFPQSAFAHSYFRNSSFPSAFSHPHPPLFQITSVRISKAERDISFDIVRMRSSFPLRLEAEADEDVGSYEGGRGCGEGGGCGWGGAPSSPNFRYYPNKVIMQFLLKTPIISCCGNSPFSICIFISTFAARCKGSGSLCAYLPI